MELRPRLKLEPSDDVQARLHRSLDAAVERAMESIQADARGNPIASGMLRANATKARQIARKALCAAVAQLVRDGVEGDLGKLHVVP